MQIGADRPARSVGILTSLDAETNGMVIYRRPGTRFNSRLLCNYYVVFATIGIKEEKTSIEAFM